LIAAAPASAGTFIGVITGYIPYSTGTTAVLFVAGNGSYTNAPSCNTTSRFTMTSGSPRYQATLAAIIAAQASGAQVKIHGLGTCANWTNSEDIDHICVGSVAC
jgi:hypothetical protein